MLGVIGVHLANSGGPDMLFLLLKALISISAPFPLSCVTDQIKIVYSTKK